MTNPRDTDRLPDLFKPLSAKVMPASARSSTLGKAKTDNVMLQIQRRGRPLGPKMRPPVRKVQS